LSAALGRWGAPREIVTSPDDIMDFVRKKRTIVENSSAAVTISAATLVTCVSGRHFEAPTTVSATPTVK